MKFLSRTILNCDYFTTHSSFPFGLRIPPNFQIPCSLPITVINFHERLKIVVLPCFPQRTNVQRPVSKTSDRAYNKF
jgi:hypothetical protein